MSETEMQLPLGFRAAGVACGIKSDPTKLDLALFLSDRPASAAGVFTTNRVCGAPVHVSRDRLPRDTARGVVINSGNANAATGERGQEDARWMTAEIARHVGCEADDVLVCSTGVIGRFLPREKLEPGLAAVVQSISSHGESRSEGFLEAARAMMTTDTVPKQAARTLILNGKPVHLAGVCKGAAMIAPNMATMLAVVMTDAILPAALAKNFLRVAVDESFHCISVDQHTSTSDSVLLFANGASGVSVESGESAAHFQQALADVCMELSQKIIRDAEGATHFVTIDVQGLQTRMEAWRIAKAVADSPLVKTAIAGNDPNWGRIVSAAGYADVPFEENECSLAINGIEVYRYGAPTLADSKVVSKLMATGTVQLDLTFTLGTERARFWTSDLTAEYVRLNAEYTT